MDLPFECPGGGGVSLGTRWQFENVGGHTSPLRPNGRTLHVKHDREAFLLSLVGLRCIGKLNRSARVTIPQGYTCSPQGDAASKELHPKDK